MVNKRRKCLLLDVTKNNLRRSFFIASLSGVLASTSSELWASNSVFEETYSLNITYKNATLEEVLDEISQQTGIKIAYSNDVVLNKRQVSVDFKTTDIKEALAIVLGDEYTFKQVDNYIAIARRTNNDNIPSPKSVADDRQWTIQGQVMENTEPPYPLAGVNIVIKGTTIGAISDNNGYFSIKAKRGDVLVFKYVGFKDYEHVVSREISNLTVSLTAE